MRSLRAIVIPLQILQEAEEESVHGHGVHTEERAEMRECFNLTDVEVLEILPGDEVTPNHNEYDGSDEIIE